MDKASVKIHFEIFGDYDPDIVSQKTGVIPTKSWRKNDLIYKNLKIKYKYDGWSISSKKTETVDASIIIKEILHKVIDKSDVITELAKQLDLKIILNVTAYVTQDQRPIIYLDKEIIDAVQRLNADIDIDIT